MVAVKAHQAQAYLSSPDTRHRAILFYGSDVGLVAERAHALAQRFASRTEPKGEVIRLDDADLDGDPGRLTIELGTVPMFGGPKIVRAVAGRRINAAALRPLIETGTGLEAQLIVEAGNLKPDDAMRSLFEKSPVAAAIACYSDAAQDLEGLIREVLKGAGLGIHPDAREALVDRLGADRALSRGEIEKLALYAQGKREIGLEDVDAIVGDVSELALDRITNAAASGQPSRAVAECGRAVSSGEGAQTIIAAAQRHFQRLHRIRVALDRGANLEEAFRQMRPALHFKQKDAFAAQCRLWTSDRLAEANRRISAAAKAARLSPALEELLTERLLLSLAMLARDGRVAPKR